MVSGSASLKRLDARLSGATAGATENADPLTFEFLRVKRESFGGFV